MACPARAPAKDARASAAVGADTVDLMLVVTDLEAKSGGYRLLKSFKLFVVKLSDGPTGLADQVVVMATRGVVFVAGLPITEAPRLGDAGVDQ